MIAATALEYSAMFTLQDRPLVIKETTGPLFGVLLPVCDAAILLKVLDPDAAWVTLIGFWSDAVDTWIEQHLPPLFDPARRMESVRVTRLEMDVRLPTAEFLRILPSLTARGLDLVQTCRPLPPQFSIGALKPQSKARVFRDLGIVLQFSLPHPKEHAVATSPSREVLERIVAAVSN
jgi:hypothetical protein